MPYLVPKNDASHKTFSEEYALHALTVSDNGLLTYKKIMLSSDESVTLTDGDGLTYGGLQSLIDNVDNSDNSINESQKGVDETSVESWQNNSGKRALDQTHFDSNKLTYYMDANGNLVARYLKDFTYNNKTGATRNWKA